MKTIVRMLGLFMAIMAILSIQSAPCRDCGTAHAEEPGNASAVVTATPSIPIATEAQVATASGPLPKLVDLGAGKCIACKKMAPVLEEAKKLYAGIAEVEFIDVWENREAGDKYGIRMIPTQIFFDKDGKEIFRHEGFFPLEDIQKQFEAIGAKLKKE